MRLIIIGNSGSGKTSLAKRLSSRGDVAWLSLDEVAFRAGSERRPLVESVGAVRAFLADHEHWVIEGCYADIIESVLDDCDELVFLNPGVETCVAHCRARAWEPDKFSSQREQDEHLERLIAWVRSYQTRTDEYGLERHRRLYESFQRSKRELTDAALYRDSFQAGASGDG